MRDFGHVRVEESHVYQIEKLYPKAFECQKTSVSKELRLGLPVDVFERLGRRRSQHVKKENKNKESTKQKIVDPKHIIRSRREHFHNVLKTLQREGRPLPEGTKPKQEQKKKKKKKKRSIESVGEQIKKKQKNEEKVSEEIIKKQKIPKSLRGLPPALLRKIQMKQAQKKDRMTKRVKDDTVLKLQALPRTLRAVRSYFVAENKSTTVLETLIAKIVESRTHDGIVVSPAFVRNQLYDIAKHCSEWCEIDPLVPTKGTCSVFRLKPGCAFERARDGIEKAIRDVSSS